MRAGWLNVEKPSQKQEARKPGGEANEKRQKVKPLIDTCLKNLLFLYDVYARYRYT